MTLLRNLRRFARDRSGATVIEYGLIAALLATAIVGGATTLGGSTNDSFTRVSDQVWGAAPSP
jgi:pilus assembly protein Flp/PilA